MSPVALVVSGGGAKGAYAAGALKYLVSQGCTKFDLYAGTSTGALVTTLALAGDYDELEIRYTTSGISDFIEPLDLQGVREQRGLVDSRPFRDTLEQVYTQAVADRVFAPSAPQLILTAVNLRTGKLTYFHTGTAGIAAWNESWEEWQKMGPRPGGADPREQLLQVLQASGSEPIKFPPVKLWRDGDWYVDGGVRTYTPMKAALAAGATELFIVMHSPRAENVTVDAAKLDNFPGVAGQTFAIVLANASAMDFAQAHARAGGVEIENRIVAPQQPIVGLGSGPNLLGRGVFNQGFADAQRVWEPLLEQRPDLRAQLQQRSRRATARRAEVAGKSGTKKRTRRTALPQEDLSLREGMASRTANGAGSAKSVFANTPSAEPDWGRQPAPPRLRAARPIAKARSPRRRMKAKSPQARPKPSSRPARARTQDHAAEVVSREPGILFHEQVRAGTENDLVVYLRDILPSIRSDNRALIPIAAGREGTTLSVGLSAPGFKVGPHRELPLVVGRDFDAQREKVTFQLTAEEPAGGLPVTRDIRADLWLGNESLGGATHYTTVVPQNYHGPVNSDGRSRSSRFVLREAEEVCDLVIEVESRNERGVAPFELSLRGKDASGRPYESRRMGTLTVAPKQLATMLQQQFEGFATSYPADGSAADIRQWRARLLDSIEVLGKWLWTRLPDKFRAEYFKLHKDRRLPASILIHSDETIVPWELIVPFNEDRTLPPLGVAHVMGRWRPALGLGPRPQQVTVAKAAILNPRAADLPWTVVEASDLKQLSPSFETVTPVNRKTFAKLMKRTDVKLLHFSGHGLFAKNADLSTLELESGDQITPMDFLGVPLLAKAQTILYLNACEAGASGVVMGQMGGFSAQCADNGCGGIVAPYWAVADDSAGAFSQAFYEKLMLNRSVGEALRELRKERPKDPTFQAYAYMGDPWVRTHFDPPASAPKKPRGARKTKRKAGRLARTKGGGK